MGKITLSIIINPSIQTLLSVTKDEQLNLVASVARA
jgi:hypothetical protein